MTQTGKTLEMSYAYCRQMCRRSGSNFYAGFLLLPSDQRRAMEALYAFMRHTDDLADAPLEDGVSRCDNLAAWRSALHAAIGANAVGATVSVYDPAQLLPALADTVWHFHIPPESLTAVIDGVEMDLNRHRYETFEELETYCERVASAVGTACIHIWGFHGQATLEPARQAGIALQMTNILRDLGEDAAAGRIYLPLADLRRHHYTEADLMAGVVNEHFLSLMRFEIERTERFYTVGAELIDSLEPAGRRMFGLMMSTYHALLQTIAGRPGEVLQHRIRLGRLAKLRLAARWALRPPRKALFP